jgi:hypothetical protein
VLQKWHIRDVRQTVVVLQKMLASGSKLLWGLRSPTSQSLVPAHDSHIVVRVELQKGRVTQMSHLSGHGVTQMSHLPIAAGWSLGTT